MASVVLDVKNLTKRYGQFTAVDGILFQLHEGEVLGLLGPNGAGKTTTIQMLLGLTIPTVGNIEYFGKDFSHHREDILQRINFASAYAHMQGKLTVWQNLLIFSGIYNVKNAEKTVTELAELLGITGVLQSLFWTLSSGQKTRVNLVRALLNKPRIILMDEPTASLDPEIVSRIVTLIGELQKKEGVAILFTSHNMTEVARVCDRVMFLHGGKIVASDTPLGLTKLVGKAELVLTFDGPKEAVVGYLKDKRFNFTFFKDQIVGVEVDEKDITKILVGLAKRRVWITDTEINKPDLEDVFLAIAREGKYALVQN